MTSLLPLALLAASLGAEPKKDDPSSPGVIRIKYPIQIVHDPAKKGYVVEEDSPGEDGMPPGKRFVSMYNPGDTILASATTVTNIDVTLYDRNGAPLKEQPKIGVAPRVGRAEGIDADFIVRGRFVAVSDGLLVPATRAGLAGLEFPALTLKSPKKAAPKPKDPKAKEVSEYYIASPVVKMRSTPIAAMEKEGIYAFTFLQQNKEGAYVEVVVAAASGKGIINFVTTKDEDGTTYVSPGALFMLNGKQSLDSMNGRLTGVRLAVRKELEEGLRAIKSKKEDDRANGSVTLTNLGLVAEGGNFPEKIYVKSGAKDVEPLYQLPTVKVLGPASLPAADEDREFRLAWQVRLAEIKSNPKAPQWAKDAIAKLKAKGSPGDFAAAMRDNLQGQLLTGLGKSMSDEEFKTSLEKNADLKALPKDLAKGHAALRALPDDSNRGQIEVLLFELDAARSMLAYQPAAAAPLLRKQPASLRAIKDQQLSRRLQGLLTNLTRVAFRPDVKALPYETMRILTETADALVKQGSIDDKYGEFKKALIKTRDDLQNIGFEYERVFPNAPPS